MNKEEINKLLKDNPIKIIKFGDIEVPVEWLEQNTVNINGDDYIRLQQENKQLKEQVQREVQVRDDIHTLLHNRWNELKKWLEEESNKTHISMYSIVAYSQTLDKIKELEEGK